MKFNLATVFVLLASLAGLVATYTAGAFASHPDLVAVMQGVVTVINALLAPVVVKAASASAAPPSSNVQL